MVKHISNFMVNCGGNLAIFTVSLGVSSKVMKLTIYFLIRLIFKDHENYIVDLLPNGFFFTI